METKSNISLLVFRRRMMQAMASKSELPQGYLPCEYIESDGTNYIDTKISGGVNSAYEIDFKMVEYVGSWDQFFGGGHPPVDIPKLYTAKVDGYFWLEGYNFRKAVCPDNAPRIVIKVQSDGSVYIDGGMIYSNEPFAGKGWGETSWWVFGCQGEPNIKSKIRLYGLKMWTDEVLVRLFVPCMKDGVFGLYDMIEKVFYSSEGGSEFSGQLNQ